VIQIPVDVPGTAARWAILTLSTGSLLRRRTWPDPTGAALQGLGADYVYLLMQEEMPPDYDSRVQALVPTEEINISGNQLLTTYTTPTLPAEQLALAIDQQAEARIGMALDLLRISTPADMVDALGLIAARVEGVTLPDASQARVDQFMLLATNYTNAVKARAEALKTWVADHPGLAPDLDAGWPDLPTGAAA
jgi:hypothetical protein